MRVKGEGEKRKSAEGRNEAAKRIKTDQEGKEMLE